MSEYIKFERTLNYIILSCLCFSIYIIHLIHINSLISKENHYLSIEIIDFQNIKEYNSNILVKAKVDNKLDVNKKRKLFYLKINPLLDPIHYLLNNYNVSNPRNFLLPSNYNFNTFTKINDVNNMAYIDVFFIFS